MPVISIRTRQRIWEIAMSGLFAGFVWLLQLTVMSMLSLKTVLCSLPLTVTIVWGTVFGSTLVPMTPNELRHSTFAEVLIRQVLSGSLSGAIFGALMGALYASVLPTYPICYPLAGWIAGYFCLRNFNSGALLAIPIVLLLTIYAEFIMALQLYIIHRPQVLQHLAQFAVPEAILDCLIAPLVYLPMRSWYELANFQRTTAEQ
jgi:rod shape-determining protein MreD